MEGAKVILVDINHTNLSSLKERIESGGGKCLFLQCRKKIPVKRLGTTKDVTGITLFLLSEESSFITGETININGGYYMN